VSAHMDKEATMNSLEMDREVIRCKDLWASAISYALPATAGACVRGPASADGNT